MPDRFRVVRVTTTQDYALPVAADGRTFNGQGVEELVQSWFRDTDLNRYHASREGCRIGGSIELVDAVLVEEGPQGG